MNKRFWITALTLTGTMIGAGILGLPYVFARNRIIFHSMYSTKLQLISICMIWIWVFMIFYWYKALGYYGRGNFSISQKIQWMFEYLKGNVAGLSFVIRNEKLVYPKVT